MSHGFSTYDKRAASASSSRERDLAMWYWHERKGAMIATAAASLTWLVCGGFVLASAYVIWVKWEDVKQPFLAVVGFIALYLVVWGILFYLNLAKLKLEYATKLMTMGGERE